MTQVDGQILTAEDSLVVLRALDRGRVQSLGAMLAGDHQDALALQHAANAEARLESRLIDAGIAFRWRDGNGVSHVSITPELIRQPPEVLIQILIEELNS